MTFSLPRDNLLAMHRLPTPAWLGAPALGLAGLLLGMDSMARADDQPNPKKVKALETRKMVSLTEQGFRSPFPVGSISKELKFEPGKMSLIPDPKDVSGGLIAIYLINSSDRDVWGADIHWAHCFLEVKDGDRWKACDPIILGCGTGIPDPERLQAGQATIFLGTDPSQGDLAGEMRFCITLQNERPLVSSTFQGRFSSERFEKAALPLPPASRSIVDGLTGKGEKKAGDAIDWRIARSPEELIAAAELERSYDASSTTKAALFRWQATLPADEKTAPCRKAVAALLERPWNRQQDAPALFDRCFNALIPRDRGEKEFGSPERFRAMTWRYLSGFRSEWAEFFVNPERWDQLEAIRKSGNEWGVDPKRVEALVEEAKASLRSADREEREAADLFLKKSAGWKAAR